MGQAILVADDHPLFRQALVMAARAVSPDAHIVEAGTLAAASQAAATTDDLQLILLDLKMPGADGFSGVALLHAERPNVPILVVSSAKSATAVGDARRFGAVGFVGKEQDLSVIEVAIAEALNGGTLNGPTDPELDAVALHMGALTPTQLRVLLGLLAGKLNKQIAHDMGIAEATVKAHMTAIMRKLDVQNRTQAVLMARALGLGLQHD